MEQKTKGPKGKRLTPTASPEDALIQNLDRAAEITIAERTLTVKKGESAVMPVNVLHALAVKEWFKMLLTFIK